MIKTITKRIICISTFVMGSAHMAHAGFPGNLIDAATDRCGKIRRDADIHRRRINEDIHSLRIRIEERSETVEQYRKSIVESDNRLSRETEQLVVTNNLIMNIKFASALTSTLAENIKGIHFDVGNANFENMINEVSRKGAQFQTVSRLLLDGYRNSNRMTRDSLNVAIANVGNGGLDQILRVTYNNLASLKTEQYTRIEQAKSEKETARSQFYAKQSELNDLKNDLANLYSALEEQNRRAECS